LRGAAFSLPFRRRSALAAAGAAFTVPVALLIWLLATAAVLLLALLSVLTSLTALLSILVWLALVAVLIGHSPLLAIDVPNSDTPHQRG
jgi:hypothetical protein